MTTVDLKQLYLELQEDLSRQLGRLRRHVSHPSAKGTGAELRWTTMLREQLPKRYRVSNGFVIDHEGTRSDQIDIIIHDRQFSPLIFTQDGVLYIPVESVFAVIESKIDTFQGNIIYAGDKAASVRRLKCTNARFPQIDGQSKAKWTQKPVLAGIVSQQSGWTQDGQQVLGKAFREALDGLAVEQSLDFGLALDAGGFTVDVESDGTRNVRISEPDTGLIVFFLQLLHRLQQRGNPPAIEYNVWGRILEADGSG